MEYSDIIYKTMGILNLPQTYLLVMPMNSEARDLGDPNKHMLSTNIRLFQSLIHI